MKKTIILLFLIIFVTFFKPYAFSKEDKPKIINEFQVGYSLNAGNTETQSLFSSFDFERITLLNEFVFHVGANFKKADSKVSEEKYNANLNYDKMLNKKISLFLFAGAGKNQFQKLDIRLDSGSGLKYSFFKTDEAKGSVSGAFLYEHEDFTDDDENKDVVRFSLRPKLKWNIRDDIVFSIVLFYKPRVDYSKDYVINYYTSLTVKSKSLIALRLSFNHKYNNTPVNGVKNNDMSLLTTLVLTFSES